MYRLEPKGSDENILALSQSIPLHPSCQQWTSYTFDPNTSNRKDPTKDSPSHSLTSLNFEVITHQKFPATTENSIAAPNMALRFSLLGKQIHSFTAPILLIPHFLFQGSLVDPQLRASNEHLLSVRVRASTEDRPGYPSIPTCSSVIQPVD